MCLSARVVKKLSDFTLDVSVRCTGGSMLFLSGPSGSGKTTLIRILAGLERPDIGRITFHDEVWVDTEAGIFLPPEKRGLGYVFQEYTLFPHLSVEKNVAFAAKTPTLVQEYLRLFGIFHLRKRRPAQLSGGERQRVALAQTLVTEPKILLLDEPFSALDQETRKILRNELAQVKERLNLPIFHVTHDTSDIACLSDQTVYISRGRVVDQEEVSGTGCGNTRRECAEPCAGQGGSSSLFMSVFRGRLLKFGCFFG